MLTYMPIITALKSGLIKPEDFIAYTPDKKRSMYVKGHFEDSDKETEFDLGWHAIIYKGFGVLLVADKATKATITASSDGINIKTLEDYSNLYRNESLQSVGVALTTDLNRKIPKTLRLDGVWSVLEPELAEYFRRRKARRDYNLAMSHSFSGGRSHNCRRRQSYSPSTRTSRTFDILHMQPILFIPPDTIVGIKDDDKAGKTKKNGFKLYPSKSKSHSKYLKQDLEITNKPMWVPIVEAIHAKAVLDTDFVEYTPDKASVSFSPNETNTEDIQTAETEYDMGGWHPILLKEGTKYLPYLIATHCSNFELEIRLQSEPSDYMHCGSIIGKNQFDIGVELLERYAKIYSSKELNVQAIPLNEKLYDALDWNLKSKDDAYYLADTFTYNWFFAAGYPLHVYGLSKNFDKYMGLKWIAEGVHGYKHCEEPASKLPIRIAIPLPEDIMVQVYNCQYDGSNEKKALKLKLASKEEKSK